MESPAESMREQPAMPRFEDGSVNLRELIRRLAEVDWLYFPGRFREGRKSQEEPMADPKHSQAFRRQVQRQIVELVNAGKPEADAMRECGLSKSAVDRWVKSINAAGSPHAADNRTPEQNRVIELERENRRLRMKVDALKTSGADIRTKVTAMAANATATRYRRDERSSAFRA